MTDNPVYIQCEHCPNSSQRWELPEGVEPIDSLNAHVRRIHPTAADPPWELHEDFNIFSFSEAVEDDLMVSQFQRGPRSAGLGADSLEES